MHDIAVYARMIYFWATNAESGKQEIIDSAIDDYLRTANRSIPDLIEKSKQGEYPNVEDDIRGLSSSVNDLPGFKRLNYNHNSKFTLAWLDL